MYNILKRIFDIIFAIIALLFLAIPIIMIAILVKLTSKGSVLYWSGRIGKENEVFKMPKFRSMKIDTPDVATHLLDNPNQYLTPIGDFLRKSSLDELPQLYNILKGDISFVGPRPALYNQDDLIALRTDKNIHKISVGLTGWAQINGRDELPIPEKIELDEYYLKNRSLLFDIKIIILTFFKVIKRDDVTH